MLRSAAQELARLRKITAVIGKYGYEELIRRSPDLPQDTDSSDLEDGGHSANAARAHDRHANGLRPRRQSVVPRHCLPPVMNSPLAAETITASG